MTPTDRSEARATTVSGVSAREPQVDKVSIAGHVGSGKSTVSHLVAESLGWRRVSTGAMFRDIAARHGMTVLEMNRHAESNREIDDEVDGHLRSLAKSDEPLVIDSRMAWHFVPDSFKVYLVVDPLVGARRVKGAGRVDETYASLEEAAAANDARQAAEAERYHDLYGVERDRWHNYDLIIETTDVTPEQVADLIVSTVHEPSARQGTVCHLSPRRIAISSDSRPDGEVRVRVTDGAAMAESGADAVRAAIEAGEPLIACLLSRVP